MTIERSAEALVEPPFPSSSLLSVRSGSVSIASTVATLSNAPSASIVAVIVIVVSAPEASEANVHGRATHEALAPDPATPVIVRFVGVSVTEMLFAVAGPAFAIVRV